MRRAARDLAEDEAVGVERRPDHHVDPLLLDEPPRLRYQHRIRRALGASRYELDPLPRHLSPALEEWNLGRRQLELVG